MACGHSYVNRNSLHVPEFCTELAKDLQCGSCFRGDNREESQARIQIGQLPSQDPESVLSVNPILGTFLTVAETSRKQVRFQVFAWAASRLVHFLRPTLRCLANGIENHVHTETLMPRRVVSDTLPGANLGFANHTHALAILLGLFTFTVCYFRSFVFPNVPLLPGGDGLGFYVAGSRIVAGQLPYRDFFEIIPAGTDLTYALLIKWFGFYAWIPGLVMDCLAAITAVLMTLIAGRLMRGFVVLLPGLLLAGFVLLGSLDATHHWFCALTAVAAVMVLLDRITLPRVAVTGALCRRGCVFYPDCGRDTCCRPRCLRCMEDGKRRSINPRALEQVSVRVRDRGGCLRGRQRVLHLGCRSAAVAILHCYLPHSVFHRPCRQQLARGHV